MAKLLKIGKVWYADIRIPNGLASDGKRKYKRLRKALSTDRRIADGRLADLIKTRNAQKHGHVPTDNSYKAAKERFLGIYKSGAKVTYEKYVRALRNLEEHIQAKELSQITPQVLTDLYIGWKSAGRGLYARNRDRKNIISFMHRCERWGYVERQDWEAAVKMDPEPRGRLLFYSRTEFDNIIKKTNGPWKTIAMLGCWAGLRPGELFFLEWSEVDLESRKIHIEAKPQYSHHVKNYERRTVPIHKHLLKHLINEKKNANGTFVVSWQNGDRPKTRDVASTYFRKRLQSAGVKGSIYTLRHTFGAWLAQAGTQLQVIRDLMGHRSVVTTEIYAHLMPETHEAAINLIP